MQVDKTTLTDLSIFHYEEELSVFHKLNFTKTNGGREHWKKIISSPLTCKQSIKERQYCLQLLQNHIHNWPVSITNGSIMVVEKFYDAYFEKIPQNPNAISANFYKIMNGADYSIIRYSIEHFHDFFTGLTQIVQLLSKEKLQNPLQKIIDKIQFITKKSFIEQLITLHKKELTVSQNLHFAAQLKYKFKSESFELIELFDQLDALCSMAIANNKFNLCFPEIIEEKKPTIQANNLFHLLLTQPVSYNITLNEKGNFLFLTGANMAGKSTFIKSLGVAVYLAHIGMGVPASHFKCSLLEGLLSNIQVSDNIVKGESYFFNEVKRIKTTIEKINDGKNWLILIDELFKGTNVQDAMKCSVTVIEGIRKIPNALFVLSTHLYEIGEGLQQYSNIMFKYFETHVENDQLIFNYQLKDGISNDRLGYLILKKEGVIDILDSL